MKPYNNYSCDLSTHLIVVIPDAFKSKYVAQTGDKVVPKTAVENETIGDRVRALRKARGISQDVLADAVGVSQEAIRKLEANEVKSSPRYIAELADFFGVYVEFLLSGKITKLSPILVDHFEACLEVVKEVLEENSLKLDSKEVLSIASEVYRISYNQDEDKFLPIVQSALIRHLGNGREDKELPEQSL